MKNIFKLVILLLSYLSINAANIETQKTQEDYIAILDNAIIRDAVSYKVIGFNIEAIKYAIEEGHLHPSNPRVFVLIRSIIRNDKKLEVLPYLATKFGESRFIDDADEPILPTAALLTNLNVVRYLVANFKHIDINARNDYGLTALHECLAKCNRTKELTKNEQLDFCEYMILRGFKLTADDSTYLNLFFGDLGFRGIPTLLYKSSKLTPEHIKKNDLEKQLNIAQDSVYIFMWFLQNGVDGIGYDENTFRILKKIYKSIDKNVNFAFEEARAVLGSHLPLFKRCQDAFKTLLIENNITKIKKIDAMSIRMLFNYPYMTNLIIDLIKSENYNEPCLIALLNKVGQVYNFNKLLDDKGNNLLWYSLRYGKIRIAALLLTLCPSSIYMFNSGIIDLNPELTNLINIINMVKNKNYPVPSEILEGQNSRNRKLLLAGAVLLGTIAGKYLFDKYIK